MKILVEVDPDEVIVALKRPEGYSDVHPELVAEDAFHGCHWRNWRVTPEQPPFDAGEKL